jgi:hypothetical protein
MKLDECFVKVYIFYDCAAIDSDALSQKVFR